MSNIITTDSLYNNQFTQNSTYKELLIFRSRWDADNQPRSGTGALVNNEEKLFWIKTIKDYPYVEISHGKPNMEWADGTATPFVNSNNICVSSSVANNPVATNATALEWGSQILIAKPIIADTGHVIGTKSAGINIPKVNAIEKLEMRSHTANNQIEYTFAHKTINNPPNSSPIANATVIQESQNNTRPKSKIKFGKTYDISQDQFDQWGHYLSQSTQTIHMPDINATSPISVTLNNGDAQISHSLATIVETTPQFSTYTNSTNTRVKLPELTLENNYNLEGPHTDAYGHANAQAQFGFALRHHLPLTRKATAHTYLSDTTGKTTAIARPKRDGDASRTAPENPISSPIDKIKMAAVIYAGDNDGNRQSCVYLNDSTDTIINIYFLNKSLATNAGLRNAYLTFTFPTNVTVTETIMNQSYIASTDTQYHYQLLNNPDINNPINILKLSVRSAGMINKSAINIQVTPAVIEAIDIPCTTATNLDDNDPDSNTIITWQEDAILQTPVMQFNEQGHINDISTKGIAFPHYTTPYGRETTFSNAIDYLNRYLSPNPRNSVIDQYLTGTSPVIEIPTNDSPGSGDQPIYSPYIEVVLQACLSNSGTGILPSFAGLQFSLYYYDETVNKWYPYTWRKPNSTNQAELEIGNNNNTSNTGYIYLTDTKQRIAFVLSQPYITINNNKIQKYMLTGSNVELLGDISAYGYVIDLPAIKDISQINPYQLIQILLVEDESYSPDPSPDVNNVEFRICAAMRTGLNTPRGCKFSLYKSIQGTTLYDRIGAPYQINDIYEDEENLLIDVDKYEFYTSQVQVIDSNSFNTIYVGLDTTTNQTISFNYVTCQLSEEKAMGNNVIAFKKFARDGQPSIKQYVLFVVVDEQTYMPIGTKPTNFITGESEQFSKNAGIENRISALEQATLQLTNISDLKSVNNLISRVANLEDEINPIEYDAAVGQMIAKNRFEKIDAQTKYLNKNNYPIDLADAFSKLLMCYTGLVKELAGKFYSDNQNQFIATFALPLLKENDNQSYLPSDDIPSLDSKTGGGK